MCTPRLRLLDMGDPTVEMRRRGFWFRMARERANLTQESVARAIGLSGRSKSTLSAWEAGTRDPRARYVQALAILYGVPVERFMQPAPTPYEAIDEWIAEASRAAAALERQDWEEEEEALLVAADARSGARGRRSA